ncbi:helix-turn-helix domain-containing protein [Terrisporobacter sp.]
MENLNFSSNLLYLRKRKRVTQEDLANYLGVTKSAVSKWELNQSYPDITLLPIIAGYFDISIDEILGYKPLMNDDEVRKLYSELIKEFSKEKFDVVYEKCLQYEKKYYTCYFLQFHLGLLYCNHAYLAIDEEKIMEVYNHAAEVFERIEENCKNANLAKEALSLKSYCNLVMGKCDEIINDLKSVNQTSMPVENILSKAYLIKGDKEKATKILQISVFNNFMNSLQSMTDILFCYDENIEKQEAYIDKIVKIIELLDLKNEYPQALLNTFAQISLIYGSKGNKENCIKFLQKCVDLISNKKVFDLKENKNKIFDYLPEFIEEMSIGKIRPRTENLIVESFVDLMKTNQVFEVIRDDIRYENMLKQLES